MIRAIAIDDEPPALELLENFCHRTDFLILQKTFTRPAAALEYLSSNETDLLFLDIQMPSITGIDFAKTIKQNPPVIFTTAYSQYAVEGFNLNAVDYLLKPYTYDRFLQAAIKARHLLEATPAKETFITVRSDYSLIKINTGDIRYIESLDNYLKIHLLSGKSVLVRMTLKSIAEQLPSNDFIRVHRSFIVPLAQVKNVRNKTIYIGDTEIPISVNYEADFMKAFLNK
ncbi:MAG: LytTR family DNA-binding domain-containing protein [Flavipsychrobacter sp.]|nr:LytTR family DNA-binding domain-containing protein [Flavipsychrobacter sp.]